MKQLPQLQPWHEPALAQLQAIRGHARLISASQGLGAFDLAYSLAASWLCQEPQVQTGTQGGHSHQAKWHQACGQCPSCRLMAAKTHPDAMVLMPETLALAHEWPLDEKTQGDLSEKKRKPSKQIRIEAVQHMIDFVQRSSSRGQGLVVLIYPAQSMNPVAANALLKSLEEPVGDTRFVLISEDLSGLLPTIRSRCQSLTLAKPDEALGLSWLQAQGVIAQDAGIWLKAAAGRPQEALRLSQSLKQVSAWLDFPQQVLQGLPISQLPPPLVETPLVLAQGLYKLCHDAMCAVLGAPMQYFQTVPIPRMPRQTSTMLAQLTAWHQSLNQLIRVAEHPLQSALMLEAMLLQAKKALTPP